MTQKLTSFFGIRTILKNYFTKTAGAYGSLRVFSGATNSQKPTGQLLYVRKDENFKITKKSSIKKLEELFSFHPYVAKEIISKHKKFSRISSYDIAQNYQSCIETGISKETLSKFPEILAEVDLPLKLTDLRSLPYDVNATVPLLFLSNNKLKAFIAEEIESKRIALLSKLLEIDEREVCKQLVRRTFLFSLNINQMETNIKLILDFGITSKEIVKDLWVLKYSSNLIKERFQLAKENNLDTFKTWMVRVQPDIFERYIKRRSDTKLILGNNSLAEYISERLDCSEEVAKYLITKQPALENKSLKKMNEMIDFLFKQGFKPIQIRRVPKILLHSVETTKKRLKELEAQGMQLDSLYVLTKSQKQYLQYCDAFIKTNKSKLKD